MDLTPEVIRSLLPLCNYCWDVQQTDRHVCPQDSDTVNTRLKEAITERIEELFTDYEETGFESVHITRCVLKSLASLGHVKYEEESGKLVLSIQTDITAQLPASDYPKPALRKRRPGPVARAQAETASGKKKQQQQQQTPGLVVDSSLSVVAEAEQPQEEEK